MRRPTKSLKRSPYIVSERIGGESMETRGESVIYSNRRESVGHPKADSAGYRRSARTRSGIWISHGLSSHSEDTTPTKDNNKNKIPLQYIGSCCYLLMNRPFSISFYCCYSLLSAHLYTSTSIPCYFLYYVD